MEIRRREFIKTMGVIGVGTLVFNPILEAFAAADGQTKGTNDIGTWYPSSCQGCSTACPIEVLVQNGRAIKVRGNQNSLVNPGTVCPRGHLIIQEAYDPDRLKTPMKRTNTVKGKGIDPQFVPITWAEAMTTIATQVLTLRNNGEAHKIGYLKGRGSSATDLWYTAFTKIIGTPNKVSHSVLCAEAEKIAPLMEEGKWHYRDYDLDNCKYLLLWGVDPTRANRQVPLFIKKFAAIKQNATITVIDPVFNTSARKAHRWVPITPGTDGALASAIAHVLLTQTLWHKPFIGDWNPGKGPFVANQVALEADFTEINTFGLVKWWNLELFDKTPAWASAITGIPEATIIEIATGMAAQAPNVSVWYGPGVSMQRKGAYTGMAIYALNGLLGSWENVGGPLRSPGVAGIAALPAVTAYQDAIATTGLTMPRVDGGGTLAQPGINDGGLGKAAITNNFANGMNADPTAIKMAIALWCNFAHSATGAARWETAFTNLPFFVHITTNASETSMFADIVLPAAHGSTEKMAFTTAAYNKHSECTIIQPLANRLFDVRGDENEMVYMLAQELSTQGFPNLLNYFNTEFKDPDTSSSPSDYTQFAEYSTKFFTKTAYLTLGGWNNFKQVGVVTNAPPANFAHWSSNGGTTGLPSGKFEFYCQKLKGLLETHATNNSTTVDAVLAACNYTVIGEKAYVPHYEPPFRYGSTTQYPLTLVDVKSRFNREGRSQNLPFYYQFKKMDPGDENWSDVVRINPLDAQALGIVDGATVTITSVDGSITCKAKLWEGIAPGIVAKSYGQGHWAYGRFASANFATASPNGGSNNLIMPEDYERLSGGTVRYGGQTGVFIS